MHPSSVISMHPSSEISMHPSSDISAPPLTLSHLDQDLTTTHRPRIPSFDHSTSCIEARYAHMPTQGNKWRTCQRKITNAHQGICRLNRNCHTSAITTLSTLTLRCFSNSLCRSHVLALKDKFTTQNVQNFAAAHDCSYRCSASPAKLHHTFPALSYCLCISVFSFFFAFCGSSPAFLDLSETGFCTDGPPAPNLHE